MKNLLFHILSVYFIFSSCTAPIEINTKNSDPVPIIYGYITDQNIKQYIRILSSSPYFEEIKESAIDNADVSIADAEGENYIFNYTEDGYYESVLAFAAKENMKYHLTVELDFDKDGKTEFYEAETIIPEKVMADSIVINPLTLMGFRHFALNLYLQEPAETKNFYLCKFTINDTISNGKMDEYIIFEDRMINGTYLNGVTINYFEDATDEKNMQRYDDDNRNQYLVSPGDKIILQVINIEEGYYHFINECVREKNGENPFFGGPPSNITTNISNGAIGYFSGYAIQELESVIP